MIIERRSSNTAPTSSSPSSHHSPSSTHQYASHTYHFSTANLLSSYCRHHCNSSSSQVLYPSISTISIDTMICDMLIGFSFDLLMTFYHVILVHLMGRLGSSLDGSSSTRWIAIGIRFFSAEGSFSLSTLLITSLRLLSAHLGRSCSSSSSGWKVTISPLNAASTNLCHSAKHDSSTHLYLHYPTCSQASSLSTYSQNQQPSNSKSQESHSPSTAHSSPASNP